MGLSLADRQGSTHPAFTFNRRAVKYRPVSSKPSAALDWVAVVRVAANKNMFFKIGTLCLVLLFLIPWGDIIQEMPRRQNIVAVNHIWLLCFYIKSVNYKFISLHLILHNFSKIVAVLHIFYEKFSKCCLWKLEITFQKTMLYVKFHIKFI